LDGGFFMGKIKLFLCSSLSILLLSLPTLAYAQESDQYSLLEGAVNQGDYVIINNESTSGFNSEYSGTFTSNNQSYSYSKQLNPEAYRVDVKKPFNIAKNKDFRVQRNFIYTPSFTIGDSKLFWVTDFVTNRDSQISAKLLYSGTHSNVWVYNNQITSLDAGKLGAEFDSKIYPIVTTNFGVESDVDGNGKVNILCYDIQDGFSGSGGYIGGYFWPGDLYTQYNSNQSEIFYIDTYPTMGSGSIKDVTKAYSTLAHEFQHMVNFNRNVFIEGSTDSMDTWLDEGMSMAAEQMYTGGVLTDRIQYYNYSNSITNGHSLLYWDSNGDVLANYSLSYLFSQYIKIQANQGNKIFKEILNDPNNDYRAVEDVGKKYINSSMTFGNFLTMFRAALLFKQSSGLYGFKGSADFAGILPKVYIGSGIQLHGGGAVVKQIDPHTIYTEPSDKGYDVTYTFLSKGNGDYDSPAIISINPISDQDTSVTGVTETGAKVYVWRSTTLLGSTVADDSGKFTIPIAKQKGGSTLLVYAEDAAGNKSITKSLTVKDTIPPGLPSVNPVGDNQTAVSGKTEASVKVIVKSGTTILGQAIATSTGLFSVKIIQQKAGTILTVYAQDSGANKSGTVSITVLDKTPPVKPIVSSVGDNQTVITGKTEVTAKMVIKSGTTVLGQGYASSTGSFIIKISSVQKTGKILTVYASDKVGNQSQTSVTVIDKTPPAAPTVNKVTYQSTAVTGKAEPGSTVYIFNGITLIGKTVSDSYGNFKATIRVQKTGISLVVAAMDKAGNQSKLVSVKVY
jgi:hypothetical protein